jgi:hypothetical protein
MILEAQIRRWFRERATAAAAALINLIEHFTRLIRDDSIDETRSLG